MSRLASSLLKLLHAIVSPDVASLIIDNLKLPRPASFRLTSKCKSSMESVVSSLLHDLNTDDLVVKAVPWFSSALMLDRDISKHEIKKLNAVKKGQVYFQSLSSMLPALCLDVHPGMTVLDLCAAPGSKTTLISSLMKGEGSLMAVDKDWVRMQRLIHNVKVTTPGMENVNLPIDSPNKHNQPTVIGNVAIFHEDERFFRVPPVERGLFDRVLVDAPCSGSGRASLFQLGSDAPAPVDWTPDNVQRHVMRQKALLLNGCQMLKRGGILIYSTCSLSVEENENVIQWLLNNKHDMALMDLTLDRNFIIKDRPRGQLHLQGVDQPSGGVKRVVDSGPLLLRDALALTLADADRPSRELQGPPSLPPPPTWAVTSGVSSRRREGGLVEAAYHDRMMRLLPCSHFEGFFMAKIIKKR